MSLTQTDIVYLAAVIDTQAVIRLRLTSDSVALPMIALSSGNHALLAWVSRVTGVRAIATHRDYTRAVCAEHCREKHLHVVSTSGRWSVTGARATVIWSACAPFMKLQTDVARETLAAGLAAPFKPATPKKMATLGWPVPDVYE